MNRDFIRLMTNEDLLEGMRIRLTKDGFREKTINELLAGAKKIIDACPRSRLCDAVFADEPEKEIRPLIDSLFPYMEFNKIGWYGVALRILGDCMRTVASNELNESDIKRLNELKKRNIEYEGADSFFCCGKYYKSREECCGGSSDKNEKTIAAKKAARKLTLPMPCDENAKQILRELKDNPEIIERNTLINNCIREVGCENTDYDAVLKKVNLLTSLFGPVGIDREAVAKQITECDIDEYIKNGDPTAVSVLTDSLYDKNQKSFYLFAVRYCAAHNPEKFPFFNASVAKALKYCREHHDFLPFAGDELLDYEKYKKLLDLFRRTYSLKDISLSELSWILTASGKLLAGK